MKKKLYASHELVSKKDLLDYLSKRMQMARKVDGVIDYWEIELSILKVMRKQIKKIKVDDEEMPVL